MGAASRQDGTALRLSATGSHGMVSMPWSCSQILRSKTHGTMIVPWLLRTAAEEDYGGEEEGAEKGEERKNGADADGGGAVLHHDVIRAR